MELESPTVHLPLKRLKNLFSTSTLAIEKDIQFITTKVQSIRSNKDTISPKEASEQLTVLITRLESLQRKVRRNSPILDVVGSIGLFFCNDLTAVSLYSQLEETNRQEQLLIDHFRSRVNNVANFTNSTKLCAHVHSASLFLVLCPVYHIVCAPISDELTI